MSDVFFRRPGEDFLQPVPVVPDALFVRQRGGRIRAPKTKVPGNIPESEAVNSDPQPEPPTKKRSPAILKNPEFQAEKAFYNDKVTASVEAEITDPESLRQVFLELFAVAPDGARQRIQGFQCPVTKANASRAEFTLFKPDFKDADGSHLDTCDYIFTATHPDAKPIESPPLKASRNTDAPFTGAIYYSPSREEYLVFESEEEAAPLLEEARKLEALRIKSHQAWEIPDPSKRMQALDQAAEESISLFGGKTTVDVKKGVEELLLIKDHGRKDGTFKGWTYIPDPTGEGKQPWKYGMHRFKKAEAQKEYDKLLKRGGQSHRKTELERKAKFKLWEMPPKTHQLWAPLKGEQRQVGDKEYFTWSGEAALVRYMAAFDTEIGYDHKKKTLKVGASGQLSGSLFEGKLSATVHIPDPKGVNVLYWLQKVKYRDRYLVDPARACMMKICLDGWVSGFVGGQVQGALAFPSLNFEGQAEGKQKAEVGATASAFAGAQAKVGAKAGIEWSKLEKTPFAKLGSIAYEYGVSVGAGAEAGFKVDFSNEKFTFRISAALAWGLGAKGGFSFDVDAGEGVKILGHLYDCVDFHFVHELSDGAYEAYSSYCLAMSLGENERAKARVELARQGAVWAKGRFKAFREWLLKQEAEFALVKIALKDKSSARTTLLAMSPEALGLTLALIMKKREETDFEAILYILHSAEGRGEKISPEHKLKWIIRHITGEYEFNGPDKEPQKVAALKAGVEKLKKFGEGGGPVGYTERNEGFLIKLKKLLLSNGIQFT